MSKAHKLSHRQWKNLLKKMPMLAVDPVVIKNGAVLLIERPEKPFRGYWTLPGGFVGYGETLKKAAEREAREETGLRTRAVMLAGIYDDPGRDPRGNIITVAFIMKIAGGEIKSTKDAGQTKFFPLNKLPKRVGFDHRRIIKDALKAYRRRKK